MMNRPIDDMNARAHPATGGILNRVYTFMVISVAVFLLALAFLPPGEGRQSVVQGVWRLACQGVDDIVGTDDVTKIQTTIESPAFVQSALQSIASAQGVKADEAWPHVTVEKVVAKVQASQDAKQAQVDVRVSSNDEAFSRLLLQSLYDQFHQVRNPSENVPQRESERQRLKQKVVSELKALDEQHTRMEAFIENGLNQARPAPPDGRSARLFTLPQVTTTPVPSRGAATTSHPSPAPLAPPRQSQLPMGMKEITNPFVARVSADQPADQPAENTPQDPAVDRYALEQSLRNSPDYQKMRNDLEMAQQRHHAALKAYADLPESTTVPSQKMDWAQAPTVVRRYRGRVRPGWLFSLLLPCCGVGLAAAAVCMRQCIPSTYYGVEDISDSLGLPIIGAVTTGQGPTIEPPSVAPRKSIRWVRRIAECVLALTVALIVFSLVTLDGFSDQLVQAPVGALMTAMDNFRALLSGGA